MNSDTSTIKVEPSMLTDDESDGEESSEEEGPKAKKKPVVVPENPFKRPPKPQVEELPLIKPARKEVAQLLAGHTEHEKKAQAVLARRQKLYEDAISVTSS